MAGIRKTLAKIADGQELDLPSGLTKQQDQIVVMVAEEMGLQHEQCVDPDEATHLTVGNLRSFAAQVRKDARALLPGASLSYDRISSMQEVLLKKIIHAEFDFFTVASSDPFQEEAAEMSLYPSHAQRHSRRNCRVSRPHGNVERKSAAVVEEVEEEEEEDEHNFCINSKTAQLKLTRLFEIYSSGTRGGVRVFLRKPDLQRFMEDARKMHQWKHRLHQKHRRIHASTNNHLSQFEEMAEELFDQTLELQEDLGTRISHGITYDFFQVFVGRSANILGWCLPGFLRAMLEVGGYV
mmetsp:Transcript_38652/g.90835  ORF Transcript_38652/g.90835 Transcript_38652/m.90835 type:complete len:295 (-) Transcript_38652:67-951(-)